MPEDYHGTSLQLLDPKDPQPTFLQTGLAIVTSGRFQRVWKKYQKGMPAEEVTKKLAKDLDRYNAKVCGALNQLILTCTDCTQLTRIPRRVLQAQLIPPNCNHLCKIIYLHLPFYEPEFCDLYLYSNCTTESRLSR
jgi:hypothetical protein